MSDRVSPHDRYEGGSECVGRVVVAEPGYLRGRAGADPIEDRCDCDHQDQPDEQRGEGGPAVRASDDVGEERALAEPVKGSSAENDQEGDGGSGTDRHVGQPR